MTRWTFALTIRGGFWSGERHETVAAPTWYLARREAARVLGCDPTALRLVGKEET